MAGLEPNQRSTPRFAILAICAAALSGCLATEAATPRRAKTAASIDPDLSSWAFVPSLSLGMKKDDAVVRVVGGGATCSGTLIAENLVLTAHHCVVERDAHGRARPHDLPAASLSVELGDDDLPWANVEVRAVVAPGCGYDGGHGDIAILVLAMDITGAPTLTPRLDNPVQRSEDVYPTGFGRCSGDATQRPTAPMFGDLAAPELRRHLRTGGPVADVGASFISADASVCPGDSGGPLRLKLGHEVVGVISASVMDADRNTSGTSYFTRLDVWRPVFAAARMIAEGASPAEIPPLAGCR